MKLLLAYDGSRCAEAAIDDLVTAGLPDEVSCHVISVAEVWLPPSDPRESEEPDPALEALVKRQRQHAAAAVEEAVTFACHAKSRIRKMFPSWKVTAKGTYGSPAWEILSKADQLGPDLIVVGSQGQSAISRFFLGSISQKVLTVARFSVRVARGQNQVDPAPRRIVIGFDGSKGAYAAVDAVAKRSWPADTRIRIVAVTDPIMPSAIGRFVPPIVHTVNELNESEKHWVTESALLAAERLERCGLRPTVHIMPGNPKRVLIDIAESWDADCIFVGANSFGSRVERYLIGSTSAAVAARAHCSVEAVRAASRSSSES